MQSTTLPLSPSITTIVMLCVTALVACNRQNTEKPIAPPPPPTVEVAEAEQKTVPIYQEYLGETAAINPIEILPQVTGILEHIDFSGGATVKKGQLLFEIDPRTYQAALTQAQANLAQTQAAYTDDLKNLKRDQILYRAQVLPRMQLDTQVAQTNEAAANVAAAKAAVQTAELNLSYTKIYAPITGRIGEPAVKVGALVTQNTTLLDTIYSINPIYVDFSVTESAYINYEEAVLKNGHQPLPAPELILPGNIVYPIKGKIVMANPTVSATTGTLLLRAQFPNPDGILRPGLSVQVKLMLREQPNAVLVPQQAVQDVQGQRSIYVVGPGDKAEFRPVKLGPVVGQMQVVDSGVKAGDRVIVEGQQKVRPGMPVTPVPQSGNVLAGTQPVQQ